MPTIRRGAAVSYTPPQFPYSPSGSTPPTSRDGGTGPAMYCDDTYARYKPSMTPSCHGSNADTGSVGRRSDGLATGVSSLRDSGSLHSLKTVPTATASSSSYLHTTATSGSSRALPPVSPPPASSIPPELWVVAPDLPEAAGHFSLLKGEWRHGMPVWAAGARRLYSNAGGGWILASDARHMETNKGWIASASPHRGKMPHEMDKWEVADGHGGWVIHDNVRTTATMPSLTTVLRVVAPNRPEVAGHYVLLDGVWWNGHPVWAAGDRRLYSGEGGWWLVDPDKKHMELDRGLLASATKHGGRPPHEVGLWEIADGKGGWIKDTSCSITAVLDEAEATATAAEAKSTRLLEEVVELREVAKSQAARVEALERFEDEVVELRRAKAALDAEVVELRKVKGELEEAVEATSTQRAETEARTATALARSNDTLADTKQQLQRLGEELRDLEQRHTELTASHSAKETALKGTRARLAEVSSELSGALTARTALEGELEALRGDHQKTIDALHAKAAELGHAQTTIGGLEKEVEELQGKLEEAVGEAKALGASLHIEKMSNQALEKQVLHAQETIKVLEAILTRTSRDASEGEIAHANEREGLEKEIESLKETVSCMEGAAEATRAELKLAYKGMTKFRGRSHALEGEKRSLLETIEGLEARCTAAEAAAGGLEDLLRKERENRKKHLEVARRAAETTVQAAADSLLQLITDGTASKAAAAAASAVMAASRSTSPPECEPSPKGGPQKTHYRPLSGWSPEK
eukprot:Sspe_Gene.78420::Locus_49054_Transcript_1_1_Confidence_1.000_Length_2506::g.78420::m.78420